MERNLTGRNALTFGFYDVSKRFIKVSVWEICRWLSLPHFLYFLGWKNWGWLNIKINRCTTSHSGVNTTKQHADNNSKLQRIWQCGKLKVFITVRNTVRIVFAREGRLYGDVAAMSHWGDQNFFEQFPNLHPSRFFTVLSNELQRVFYSIKMVILVLYSDSYESEDTCIGFVLLYYCCEWSQYSSVCLPNVLPSLFFLHYHLYWTYMLRFYKRYVYFFSDRDRLYYAMTMEVEYFGINSQFRFHPFYSKHAYRKTLSQMVLGYKTF